MSKFATEDGISVVICTYDDPIDFFSSSLNSLLQQEKIEEIIIVDSSKSGDIKSFCNNKNEKIRYTYMAPKGLSEARNEGIRVSKKNIVAFTDPDCIVDENWAENISTSFAGQVAIVGGKVVPKWLSKSNKIFLNSAIAQGFYSLFDMGDELKEVNQVFGGNFAINKSLTANQSFLSRLGRRKGNLLCGEEADFCKQVKIKNLKIIYNPSIIVWHQIPAERINFRWMRKRMYYTGITRAMLGGRPTPKTVKYINFTFYDILFLGVFLIYYIAGYVRGKIFDNHEI